MKLINKAKAQAMKIVATIVLMLTPSVCFAQASVRTLAGVNAQTGTSYTITAADQTKLLTFNNANPVAVTLPSPANTNFGIGAIFSVRNLGAGRVTITPTGSTIDNAATLTLDPGQGADIYSDGTNYETQKGSGLGLFGAGAPTGSCINGSNYTNTTNGNLWVCQAGTWVVVSGGGGGGSPSVGANGTVQVSNGSGLFSSSGNVFDLNSLFSVNEDAALKGPNPVGADIRAFGGVSFNPNIAPAGSGITSSCNGTTAITLSAASLFVNGGGIAIKGCGANNTMSTPGAPTVTTNEVQSGMGTGNVVAGLTGATTYNYKIAAQDLGMGITAASTAGSVTTGPTSLGAQSVNITSCARSNATVTCVTATHGISVGAEIKIRGMADASFNGNWNVATVPDTTHFTYTGALDTRTGATTSTTGGTVVYWPCNHLTWSAVTGAYRYLIYSDRGSPGTFNLIGISKPSYPGTIPGSGIGTDGSLYFDDFGTVTTYPTPPWTVSSTAPASATNDTLVTTIISGAGTTSIVVASSASQTLASTPTRADNTPIIKAAASNGIGTVLIPTNGNYVTNSILDLSQIQGVMINVLNKTQTWGDTVIFGYQSGIHGSRPVISASGGASFAPGTYADALVFGMPGFHFAGNPFDSMSYFQVDGQSNGQTNLVVDGSGGETEGFEINNVALNNGSSSGVDDMSMGMMVRGTPGQSGQFNSSGRLSAAANQSETNAETPLIYNSSGAQNKINEIFLSGRGVFFHGNTAGSTLHIGWLYCQGCNTPMITVAGAKTGGGNSNFSITVNQLWNDTGVSPLLSALNASGTILLNASGFAGTIPGTPGFSGNAAGYATTNLNGQNISSETVSSTQTGSGGALDGIFFSGVLGGAGTYANKIFNAALSTANAYPIFVTGSVIAAPAVALAAGGNLPLIPLFYEVTPAWPNGGTGPNSLVSASITPTTGNQTINLTWTPLGATAGCTGYYILRGASATSFNITSSGGGFVSGCGSSSYSDSSNVSNGGAPTITSGGPTMLMPTTQGAAAPKIQLAANVTVGAQSGTAYTVNLPGVQPTSGNTFLSCTAANPSNCSWASGGAGLPWNQIGNPTGNFNPSMGSNTSVFSYSTGLANAFEWANNTAATVTTSQSSPQISLCGNAWTGASSFDCFTLQHVIGNGVNAAITDTYGHTGVSTGIVTSLFPGPVAAGAGPGNAGAVIIPQGTSNSTTTGALTIQGATAITPYSIALPGSAPTSTNNFLSCSSATSSLCTWQNGFGVGNGAAAVMGYYLTNTCPAVSPDGFCFNTPANTKYDKTCSWTNASTTVTCTDTPFATGDVGKQVGGWNACATDLPSANYGGAIVTGALVTISTFTDSNHVVLSATPSNSSTPVSGETCFVWGNPDDAAASAIDTAIQNQTAFCPMLHLAAGGYLFNNPHFGTQPAGCKTIPNLSAGQSLVFGNLGLPGGFRIEGRGAGATIIHLGTNFPGTTTCNQYTYNSQSSCFAIPPLGEWRSFELTGDGQANTCGSLTGSPPANQGLVYSSVGGLDHVIMSNFCGFTTGGNVGLVADAFTWMDTLNNAAFGDIGLQVKTGALAYGLRVSIENNPTANAKVFGNFTCTMCGFLGATTYLVNSSSSNFGSLTVGLNGFVKMFGGELSDTPFANNVSSSNPGLLQMAGNSSNARMDNVLFFNSNSVTNTGAFAIFNAGTGTNLQIKDSSLVGFASGHGLQVNAGNINFVDQGGNTFPAAMATTFFNYNPVGGGSSATSVFGNPTNFGTAIGSTALIADVPGYTSYVLSVNTRQNVLGVGCGAGTNTAQITITWTAPGGTVETITPTLLSISANGVLDTGVTAGQTFTITPGAHTAVNYSVASTLASAGCSTVPQYSQVIRVL